MLLCKIFGYESSKNRRAEVLMLMYLLYSPNSQVKFELQEWYYSSDEYNAKRVTAYQTLWETLYLARQETTFP